jgi:hypothetical protein
MPHLVHMVVAVLMLLLFGFATLCMVSVLAFMACAALQGCTVGMHVTRAPPCHPCLPRHQQSISDCSLNPLTRDHLASPVALTNLKTMGLKMAMVVLSTGLGVLGRAQPVAMLVCAAIITYYLLTTVMGEGAARRVWAGATASASAPPLSTHARPPLPLPSCLQLPYYHDAVNCAWVGLWCGITYTTIILVVLSYSLDAYNGDTSSPAALHHRHAMTMVRRWCVCVGGAGAVSLERTHCTHARLTTAHDTTRPPACSWSCTASLAPCCWAPRRRSPCCAGGAAPRHACWLLQRVGSWASTCARCTASQTPHRCVAGACAVRVAVPQTHAYVFSTDACMCAPAPARTPLHHRCAALCPLTHAHTPPPHAPPG